MPTVDLRGRMHRDSSGKTGSAGAPGSGYRVVRAGRSVVPVPAALRDHRTRPTAHPGTAQPDHGRALLGLPEEHPLRRRSAALFSRLPARSVSPDFPVAARLERDRNYERKTVARLPHTPRRSQGDALRRYPGAGAPAAAMLPDSPADPLKFSLFAVSPRTVRITVPAVEKRRARASAGRRRAGRRFPRISHCSAAQFLRYRTPVAGGSASRLRAIRVRFA